MFDEQITGNQNNENTNGKEAQYLWEFWLWLRVDETEQIEWRTAVENFFVIE